jgi:hypothetical protein
MSHVERLDEIEAATEAQVIIGLFSYRSGRLSSADYDLASAEVTRIKGALASMEDETLIEFYQEAYNASDSSSEYQNLAALLQHTLQAVAYLDSERAAQIYRKTLQDTKLEEETVGLVPICLLHLTRVVGDSAIPLWAEALSVDDSPKSPARQLIGIVVDTQENYPLLSEKGAAEMEQLFFT